MGDNLIRFKQRYVNFEKAVNNFKKVESKESLTEIEQAGLVQFFEVAFELSWKVMRDVLQSEGYEINSPKETIKRAFEFGLIDDGEAWLDALQKRNLSSHTYDNTLLDELENQILHKYYPLMEQLKTKLQKYL